MYKENFFVRSDILNKYCDEASHDYFKDKKLSVTTEKNAVILPPVEITDEAGYTRYKGGVISSAGEFIENSAHYREKIGHYWGSVSEGYTPNPSDLIENTQDVIYGGFIHNHFGHFLLECTSRLWYICQNESALPLVFVGAVPLKEYIYLFLNALGISNERILSIDKPTRFKTVIVPERSCVIRNYYTKEFILPFQKINVAPKHVDKIYLSREKYNKSPKIYGEKKISKVFKQNGYKIIYPEKLSLLEQIAYIKSAKSIAGIYGSATHLALFASENTELIIINRSDDINNNQTMINQAAKLSVCRVDGHNNFLPTSHVDGPFVMGITRQLLDFFIHKNFVLCSHEESAISFISFIRIIYNWFYIYLCHNHEFNWLPKDYQFYLSRAKNKIKLLKFTKWHHIFYCKEKIDNIKYIRILWLVFKRK